MENLYTYICLKTDSINSSPKNANMWEIGVSFQLNDGKIIDEFYSLIKCRTNIVGNHTYIKQLGDAIWQKYESTLNTGLDQRPSPKAVFRLLGEKLFDLSKKYNLIYVAKNTYYDWIYFKYYYDEYTPREFYQIEKTIKCISFEDIFQGYCYNIGDDVNKILNNLNDENSHINAKKLGEFYTTVLNYFAKNKS